MNLHQLLALVILSLSYVGFSQEDMVTFEVDDVEPATEKLNETTFNTFVKNRFKKKVYSFPREMKNKKVVAHFGNGFLQTIRFAYNDHRPLELTPDVIW